jgi:hypothetical protein
MRPKRGTNSFTLDLQRDVELASCIDVDLTGLNLVSTRSKFELLFLDANVATRVDYSRATCSSACNNSSE